DAYRAVVPESVTLGVAGDAFATSGLLAGADAWYSVIGGTLPQAALQLFRAAEAARGSDEAAADEASAAQTADAETTAANPTAAEAAALRASARLEPIWELFAEFGSVRV